MTEIETEYSVSRERYNEFVQMVEREADAFRMERRVKPTYQEGGRIDGRLEVFWERWWAVANETRAMSPEVDRTIRPDLWETIKSKAAWELAKS